MNTRIARISFLIAMFCGISHAVNYLVEDRHQRFYRHEPFVMSEQAALHYEGGMPQNEPSLEKTSRCEIIDGVLYDSDGQKLAAESQIYVMDQEGTLYTTRLGSHHSYFLKSIENDPIFGVGRDVACAGHLTAREGKIVAISNSSGHYLPREDQLKLAVKYLHEKGVVDPDVEIDMQGAVGDVVRIPLLSVLQENAANILDKYPPNARDFNQEYVDNRIKHDAAYQKQVESLRILCPRDFLSKPVSMVLPSFKAPKQAGRFELGNITINDQEWQMVLENGWNVLPIEVTTADTSAFVFTDLINSWSVREEEDAGITHRRGACLYSVLHQPAPQKAFTLYLLPIAK